MEWPFYDSSYFVIISSSEMEITWLTVYNFVTWFLFVSYRKIKNLVKTWQGRGRCGRVESGKNLAGKKELWDSTWSQDSGKINS